MAERDFEELLGLFNKHRVRYCIVGAYAVAFHARPRFTKDLDILVEPSPQNGQKIVRALKEFGFGALRLASSDFARPDKIIQLGYEPLRIDLLTSIEGCSFKNVWSSRVRGQYGRKRAWFIGRVELIHNKKASGRKQDRVDLDLLQTAKTAQKRSKK